jgi:hypothetical protein
LNFLKLFEKILLTSYFFNGMIWISSKWRKWEMISTLILDTDRDYADMLAQRLAAAGREFSVTSVAPGNGDAGSAAAGSYDFVIMGEDVAAMYANGADGFGGARRIILCASVPYGAVADERATDLSGPLYANRCGRVSRLVALIRSAYAARPGSGGFPWSLASGAVKYIGCFGLDGACGASSIAIGIGRDIAAYNDKRVLYVSFETLEAEKLCIRDAAGERHIGDFMYLMLKGREADMRMFSEACLFRDSYGLARFFPSPGLNELARASPQESGEFLRFFDGCGGFDIIVLDLGNECKASAMNAAGLCDALVLVENGSLVDVGKRDRATALIRGAWQQGGGNPVLVENMLRFSYDGDGDGAGAGAGADAGRNAEPGPAEAGERIEIAYDSASFRHFDGVTDFVLSNEFGLGIRKITNILLARIYSE